MAKLIGIAIKREKRAPMEELTDALVSIEAGVTGDYRGAKPGKRLRQVTILSNYQWTEACAEIKTEIPWTLRRSNLLVFGCAFGPGDVGKKMRIGKHLLVEITGETAPCKRMDEAYNGLKNALKIDWRGGVNCRVLREGNIKLEDRIYWED